MTLVRSLPSLAILALVPACLCGAEPPAKDAQVPAEVSYYRDIRPIFAQRCQGCHQPAKAGGGYTMVGVASLLKKSDKDLVGVVPGKPAESELMIQITSQGGKPPAMPRGKEPLLPHEIELIKKWIAQGARDDSPLSTREVVDEKHPPVYHLPPVVTSLAYSPDGSLLAVSGYHEVLLYQVGSWERVARFVGLSERIQALAFSPDGHWLAVAGGSPCRFGEIQVWDVTKKKLDLAETITFDTLYGVSWSPDGTKIAFGCADNTVRAIDADDGTQILFQGAHSDWVLDTVFSGDGLHLVSVSRDMSMKLTEVATQRFIDNVTSITPGVLKGGLQTVARRPLKEKRFVKSPPDPANKLYDELLIGGSDGVPRLYKMHRETKRVIGDDANKLREYGALPGRLNSVSFSADGEQFVVGSSLDGTGEIRVYQTKDAKLVATFQGQAGPVYSVAYRPDGKEIAAAGFDGKVRLIDPQTGKLIKDFVAVPLAK